MKSSHAFLGCFPGSGVPSHLAYTLHAYSAHAFSVCPSADCMTAAGHAKRVQHTSAMYHVLLGFHLPGDLSCSS